MKTYPSTLNMALAILLTLIAVPTMAADLVIDSGLDTWITRGNGSTHLGFENDPLPADFFCSGSEPFVGDIVLKGVPVATHPAGVLNGSDTILQRLDDAVFDKNGVATTRLQMRALHLEGVELLKNWCGSYRVEVVLDGEQPVTEMRIYREVAAGGRFEAEVAVNAKLVFTPVDHHGEVLEVARNVVFPPRLNSFWARSSGRGVAKHTGFVVVDTDSNGEPDTFLPGMSRNFAAGAPATPEHAKILSSPPTKAIGCPSNCHCDPGCSSHCLCSSDPTVYCP